MEINNINGGPFLDPSKSADKVNRPETSPQEKLASTSIDAKKGDQVTLSSTEYKTDKAFGLSVLEKLNTDSASRLGEIKAKIVDGTYNKDEVINKLSQALADELSNVPSVTSSKFDQERIDFLTNSAEVQETVANKISKEINNI